ncbi:MAG: spheroidene monooxygenase [Myxococcota bacterium]
MGVVSLSFFRFQGAWPRFWAFTHMQLAKGPLSRLPGVAFSRTLGTGSGDGFDPYPNFSVYALLAAWPSLDHAQAVTEESRLYARYRAMSVENWTVFLQPSRAKGQWGGTQPFEVMPKTKERSATTTPGPVAVLTRATIRAQCMPAFWRSVPAVSRATRSHPGLRFKVGLGELPFVQLMTFSLWDDEESIRRFAYAHGAHHDTLRRAHAAGWFREDLFARFRVLDSKGSWEGLEPLTKPAQEPAPVLRAMS